MLAGMGLAMNTEKCKSGKQTNEIKWTRSENTHPGATGEFNRKIWENRTKRLDENTG